jgi:hypothetical protein
VPGPTEQSWSQVWSQLIPGPRIAGGDEQADPLPAPSTMAAASAPSHDCYLITPLRQQA